MKKLLFNSFNFILRKQILFTILGIYLILTFLYWYLFMTDQWHQTCDWLDKKMGNGFAISFSASLSEDLIVFIFLSIFVAMLTTKSINKYSFYEKISGIINSKTAIKSDGIKDFLQDSISDLLAYDKLADVCFTISAYNSDKNAYKIYVEMAYYVHNICNDRDYKTREAKNEFFVNAADASDGNDFGEVSSLFVKDCSTGAIETIVKASQAHNLNKEFRKQLDISLKKDCSKEIHLKYYIWSKTSELFDLDMKYWNFITTKRFVETLKFKIRNELKQELKFKIALNKQRQTENNGLSLYKDLVLSPECEYTRVFTSELYPKDDVRLYIFKQE